MSANFIIFQHLNRYKCGSGILCVCLAEIEQLARGQPGKIATSTNTPGTLIYLDNYPLGQLPHRTASIRAVANGISTPCSTTDVAKAMVWYVLPSTWGSSYKRTLVTLRK